MWSLHYGVKQSDNSVEDFVHGYSLPWELETISSSDAFPVPVFLFCFCLFHLIWLKLVDTNMAEDRP